MRKIGQSGYTLMEVVVATAISSILLLGIMTFLVNSIVNNSVRGARADLLREAQLALDTMVKDIRLSSNAEDANHIPDDNSPNAGPSNGLGWESDESTLVLASAVEDTDGNIVFEDATQYIPAKNNIVYYVSDGTLYKRTIREDVPDNASITTCPPSETTSDCPADRLSVKDVESLVFTYYDANDDEVDPALARSVEAELTLHAIRFGRPITVSYSTRTVFRNE